MTSYHQTPYTLDEKVEIPADAPLTAGHSEDDAANVKDLSDAYRAQAKAEVEAEAEATAKQAEDEAKAQAKDSEKGRSKKGD